MTNIKSGINIFDSTSITIGDGTSNDGYIYINNDSPAPYLRHNTTGWIFSNDGVNEVSIGTGFTSYTIGDILYANSSNTLNKLPIGSEGYILSVSSGIPAWIESSGGSSNHNLLSNLQGGETDGYYHLTSDQYTWLIDGYVDGYWTETKGGTGQTSYTTGDILYASNTGTLSKLNASTDGYVLSLSSGIPTWVASSSSGSSETITLFKGLTSDDTGVSTVIGACYIDTSTLPNPRTVIFRCILESTSLSATYAAIADLYDTSGALGTPAQVSGSQINNIGVTNPQIASMVEADISSAFTGTFTGVFEVRLWILTTGGSNTVTCKSAELIIE